MKISDDYDAKIKLWVANPKVVPLPPGPTVPKFRSKKFNSYADTNETISNSLFSGLNPGFYFLKKLFTTVATRWICSSVISG